MVSASTTPRSWIVRMFSVILLITSGVSLVVLSGDVAYGADEDRLTIAVVNEDVEARFNGDDYTFGTSFLDRISKDSQYNWIVLSRAVAEKAYKDGSVDAVLFISQSFSQDILTLQDLTPTKATVEYKLRPQSDERADRLLESEVIAIVRGFNESVIKMYYASLADTLAEADGQMHSTLTNQEALVAALTADVQEPFSATLPSIESFVAGATSLKDVNSSTVEAQNMFQTTVKNSLTANSEALTAQLPVIDEYTSRQQEIAQINTTNSNKGITDQASSDLQFYGSQFEGLRVRTLCALSGLDPQNLPEPCMLPDGSTPPNFQSRLTELRQSNTQNTADHAQAVDNLFTDLDTRILNLRVAAAMVTDPTVVAALETEVLALEATRDSLSANLPGPALDSALANLDSWYNETLASTQGASLTASTVTTLGINDWTTYNPDGPGLYIDSSDELHTSIAGLVSQSAQTSDQIASSASAVPDNSGQFAALLQNAKTTFGGAESVFTGLNALLASGNAGLNDNRAYYANFATVLANTRTAGADSSIIYDFFSAPIDAKNITQEQTATVGATNPLGGVDLRWVAVFVGGLLVGILATKLGTRRKAKKA